MLTRLVYVSRVAASVDTREARSILSSSQTNNPRRCITGILIFNSGYFVQWLEGSRAEVSSLFAHIARDARHNAVELIDFSDVPKREFPEWGMGYVGEGILNRELFARYAEGLDFNPYILSRESAVEFIREASAVALLLARPA